MDCCELARLALWIIGGALGVILALLAMFFNYSLKLDARTLKLEKKNGHERSQFVEQSEQLKQLSQRITKLEQNKTKDHA